MSDCEIRARIGGPSEFPPREQRPAWAESEGRDALLPNAVELRGSAFIKADKQAFVAAIDGGLYEQRNGMCVPTVLRERLLGQPERPERGPQNVAACPECLAWVRAGKCACVAGAPVSAEPVSASPGRASKAGSPEYRYKGGELVTEGDVHAIDGAEAVLVALHAGWDCQPSVRTSLVTGLSGLDMSMPNAWWKNALLVRRATCKPGCDLRTHGHAEDCPETTPREYSGEVFPERWPVEVLERSDGARVPSTLGAGYQPTWHKFIERWRYVDNVLRVGARVRRCTSGSLRDRTGVITRTDGRHWWFRYDDSAELGPYSAGAFEVLS